MMADLAEHSYVRVAPQAHAGARDWSRSSAELLADLLADTDTRAHGPYGLTLPASDALVHLGSCTANPITPRLLARHAALQAAQAGVVDPADVLCERYGAAQCVLAASGTDAEYTCALAMGAQAFLSVLMDPAEVGSGCTRAALGQPHAVGGPVSMSLGLPAQLASIALRGADGLPLHPADVDAQVLLLLKRHANTPVLLHHVPCSKTGLTAPSEAACLHVQRSHPAGARVVVDASQGRCSTDDVQRWLGYGWAVILTGSKYWGAPPFCGATLLPQGWPRARGFAATAGLLARWRLALCAMDACAAGLPALHDLRWMEALREGFLSRAEGWRIDDDGALDGQGLDGKSRAARSGILSFDVGLDAARTRALHRALIGQGYFIGQPVAAGSRHWLRVAVSAHTPLDRARSDLTGLAHALQRLLRYT